MAPNGLIKYSSYVHCSVTLSSGHCTTRSVEALCMWKQVTVVMTYCIASERGPEWAKM